MNKPCVEIPTIGHVEFFLPYQWLRLVNILLFREV